MSVGVTYMTGTLVKLGQRLAVATMRRDRWAWLPYLILWCSLVTGAAAGAFVCVHFEQAAIGAAAIIAALLTLYATWIGPAERPE